VEQFKQIFIIFIFLFSTPWRWLPEWSKHVSDLCNKITSIKPKWMCWYLNAYFIQRNFHSTYLFDGRWLAIVTTEAQYRTLSWSRLLHIADAISASVRCVRYCSRIFEKIEQVLYFPRNSHNLYWITKYFWGAHYLRNCYYIFLQFPEFGCCDLPLTEVLSWRSVMG